MFNLYWDIVYVFNAAENWTSEAAEGSFTRPISEADFV